MTYIKKLQCNNIGTFDSLKINFSPRNNIIIGSNSSGKTTILKLICLSFSNVGAESLRFRKNSTYSTEFKYDEVLYSAGVKIENENDLGYRERNFNNWVRVENNYSFLPYENHPYNLFAIGAYRFFEYERINGMQREENGDIRRKQYLNGNIESLQKPNIPNIKQWMINRYFIVDKDWAIIERENWEKLINYLPKIVPTDQEFKFLRIERDLEPIFEINGKECYLDELSGGFKSIISIIFSIIDWCEGTNEGQYGNISKSFGTVLIDEIDAHLHPQWQSKILEHLNILFPKIQFIVTTHSPHVIANASINEIIRIPSHDGNVDLSPMDRDFSGWDIKDILNDLMGYHNSENSNILSFIEALDSSLKNKDESTFDLYFNKLETILHSNDPILKVYQIKKSKIFLHD